MKSLHPAPALRRISRRGRPSFFWMVVGLSLTILGRPLLGEISVVSTDKPIYLVGEPIRVTFQGGPGNAKDWIAIYPAGVEPTPVPPGGTPIRIWQYVDGTQTGSQGVTAGTITFAAGLDRTGEWTAYLLVNDGFTKLGQATFQVVDALEPFVQVQKQTYLPGEGITVSFANGPSNPKDWVAIYPADRQPGMGIPLIWWYVDETHDGLLARSAGAVTFAAGLARIGNYVAYFLENDGYTILASDSFTVDEPAGGGPRVLIVEPAHQARNVVPIIQFSCTITNGTTRLQPDSIGLFIDDAPVTFHLTERPGLTKVAYTNATLLPPNSAHRYLLNFSDDAIPPNSYTQTGEFLVADYDEILLPPPLIFEDFDAVEEGKLPVGWSSVSYSVVNDEVNNLQDLNSKAYADWLVVDRERFNRDFVGYDSHDVTRDYERVLSVNPFNVVNGTFLRDLVMGRFVFGNSGYRDGDSQFLVLVTPDFNLTGASNIVLSFHNIWEQNQDSIGAVEYSIDRGSTWLPILYQLHQVDVLTNETGSVDAVATFSAPYADVARFTDPATGEEKGGTYGAFIGAVVGSHLAPFIRGRVDDDPIESKRVEWFHLPRARNQPQVRFRFAHAGTDSWYFGLDNFGLYSIPGTDQDPVSLSFSRTGNELVVSWPVEAVGFMLESAASVTDLDWRPVTGVVNNSVTIPLGPEERYYRLFKNSLR